MAHRVVVSDELVVVLTLIITCLICFIAFWSIHSYPYKLSFYTTGSIIFVCGILWVVSAGIRYFFPSPPPKTREICQLHAKECMPDNRKPRQASRRIAIPGPPEFPKLGELPAEIQLLIWDFAANLPRPYPIQTCSAPHPHWKWDITFLAGSVKTPAVLQVCQISRGQALKSYTLSFAERLKKPIYFNFQADQLYFKDGSTLESFARLPMAFARYRVRLSGSSDPSKPANVSFHQIRSFIVSRETLEQEIFLLDNIQASFLLFPRVEQITIVMPEHPIEGKGCITCGLQKGWCSECMEHGLGCVECDKPAATYSGWVRKKLENGIQTGELQDLIVRERACGYVVDSATEELLEKFVAPEIVCLTPSELRAKYCGDETMSRKRFVVENSEEDTEEDSGKDSEEDSEEDVGIVKAEKGKEKGEEKK